MVLGRKLLPEMIMVVPTVPLVGFKEIFAVDALDTVTVTAEEVTTAPVLSVT